MKNLSIFHKIAIIVVWVGVIFAGFYISNTYDESAIDKSNVNSVYVTIISCFLFIGFILTFLVLYDNKKERRMNLIENKQKSNHHIIEHDNNKNTECYEQLPIQKITGSRFAVAISDGYVVWEFPLDIRGYSIDGIHTEICKALNCEKKVGQILKFPNDYEEEIRKQQEIIKALSGENIESCVTETKTK